MDFLFDSLHDSRRIKIMPVEDLFSRFSIGIYLNISIKAEMIVGFLQECFRQDGRPEIIRADQGPEFICLPTLHISPSTNVPALIDKITLPQIAVSM